MLTERGSELVYGKICEVMCCCYYGCWPQGIRRKSVTHLHRFDYGGGCSGADAGASAGRNGSSDAVQMRPSCNRDAYAQKTPPVYDVAEIKTPLALFTGGCRGCA